MTHFKLKIPPIVVPKLQSNPTEYPAGYGGLQTGYWAPVRAQVGACQDEAGHLGPWRGTFTHTQRIVCKNITRARAETLQYLTTSVCIHIAII